MKIGIIDADLLGRTKHRFPNLVCEKISGYYKEKGANVELIESYDKESILNEYDDIYISKVFTHTPFPEWLTDIEHIHLGGTGFYFDKAPNLPDEIEHHMPDYHLYDDWISKQPKPSQYKEYQDCSIGFLTRGCFRKCGFCVNQKYNHVFKASTLEEFYDPTRRNICLLDDNFLGCPSWKEMLTELQNTNKPFYFKQGLDERILTDEKCEMLFSSKYKGDFTFAFDNIDEYELIENKLKMIRKHTNKSNIKFYILCAYKSVDETDIDNAFKRISLLIRYKCLPYVMLYQSKDEKAIDKSKYRGIYVSMQRWCNQPGLFKKLSFREFCIKDNEYSKNLSASMRTMLAFESEHPEIAKHWFDMKYSDYVNDNKLEVII